MRTSILATCFGIAGLSAAQLARYCPSEVTGICYSVNVPTETADKNSGDIYFQIQGPSSNQWIGFGQSEGYNMAGSNIFIIYSDSSNKNVTLSPRLGVGEVQPLHDTTAEVTLLAGSGIENGVMTANVRCANCNSWNGGSLSFTSTSSSWIWSQRTGDPIASDDVSENLIQHDVMGSFTLDLTAAKGGSSSNPFLASTTATNTTGPAAPSSTASPASNGGNIGSSDSGASDAAMLLNVHIAHGTLMGLAFVILFPWGALIRRIAPSSSIWIHASAQMFAWVVALAGMGLGIWMALQLGELTKPHPIIGLVTVSAISLQPIGGLLQHSYYKKHGKRGVFGYGHIAMGVSLILLGTINGGLGLQLAHNSNTATIAYGVIAGVLYLLYAGIVALTAGRKRKSETRREKVVTNETSS